MSDRAAIRRLAVLFAFLVACAPARATPSSQPSSAATAVDVPGTGAVTAAPPKVRVTSSTYGALQITADAGAECSAEIHVAFGNVGENPVRKLSAQVVSAAGALGWTYAAPRIPQTRGEYAVSCTRGGAKSETVIATFDTFRPPMVATGLTVHVTTDAPPDENFAPDPSLVPLRDTSVVKMKSTLTAEWKAATRGLGGVQVVDQSADITVFVVNARGTSVNRHGADGSEDIVIYVSGEFGPKSVENVVATTLHELGHIWCCHGPDADDGAHWKQKLRDPGLYGVDKYGLMTDPVTCVTFGAIVSCPNRFSDREMRALGFTSFPPVTPDACVSQGLSLQAKLAPMDASLSTMKSQIDANRAKLSSLLSQMSAISAQYPAGLPPAVFATYESLRAQYNSLVDANNAVIDQYNATLEQAKALDAQMNALACDWT